MLKQSSNFIYLGLRPNGKHEYVTKATGEVYFGVEPEPELYTDVDILLTPFDVPFTARPRSFLSELRSARTEILVKSRSIKKKTVKEKKEVTDVTPTSTKRSKRSSSLLSALESSGLPLATIEFLKKSL